MPKIAVSDRCTGHGRCYSAAPDLLQDDEEGLVTIRNGSKVITDNDLQQAEEARQSCPEGAISITNEP